MQIVVSSSLEGRDLAVLKSVLNILHSDDQFNAEKLSWAYKDSAQHQIYIAQDFHAHGIEYYALIKSQGKKIVIGDNINPKNLRKLFEVLSAKVVRASSRKSQVSDVESSQVKSSKALFLKGILDYMREESTSILRISSDEATLYIDKKRDLICGNHAFSQSLIGSLFSVDNKFSKHQVEEVQDNMDAMSYESPATHFLWRIGILSGDQLIDASMSEAGTTFRQVGWPDYGSMDFEDVFVSISALLWRRAESYSSLTKYRKCDEKSLIRFLNAACLSGFVTMTVDEGEDIASIEPILPANSSSGSLLSRLKQSLFG